MENLKETLIRYRASVKKVGPVLARPRALACSERVSDFIDWLLERLEAAEEFEPEEFEEEKNHVWLCFDIFCTGVVYGQELMERAAVPVTKEAAWSFGNQEKRMEGIKGYYKNLGNEERDNKIRSDFELMKSANKRNRSNEAIYFDLATKYKIGKGRVKKIILGQK